MFCLARFVVNANSTTAPKQGSNEQKTARIDSQIKRFVVTIAAATYKQNYQNEPSAITTTIVCVVVKQIVEH